MTACKVCGENKVRSLAEIIAATPAHAGRVAGKELETDPLVRQAWDFEGQGVCSFECLNALLSRGPQT